MSALSYGRNDDKTLWLRFSPCTRKPTTWKEEIFAAAVSIAERAKKPIWVCSSGGIDSELACRAFLEQGIPFKVLTLEHEGGTNQHDIRYAQKWCAAHGVEQKVVKIDIVEFLSREVDRYAERYFAVHPYRYFQIKLMEIVEELGGFAVMCSGEQLYYVDRSKPELARKDVHLPLTNGTIVPLLWCSDNGTEHEPYFHFATPELCLSYMELPVIHFALENPGVVFRHPSNTYTLKRLAYQSVWTDLEVRYKFDGYEHVRDTHFKQALKRLHEKFDNQFVKFDPSVPEIETQLTGN